MEKKDGNIYIGATGAKIIAAIFALLVGLVGYIYVGDQIYQQQQSEKFDQKLKVFEIQLNVMTDVLRIADPLIDEKIFRKLYIEKGKENNYRGVQINQNYDKAVTVTNKKTGQPITLHYSEISTAGTHRKFGNFVRVNKKSIYIVEPVEPIIELINSIKDNGDNAILYYPHAILDAGDTVVTTLAFIPEPDPFVMNCPDGVTLVAYDFIDKQNRAGTGQVELFDWIVTLPDDEIRISIVQKEHFDDAVKFKNSHPELERPIIANLVFRFNVAGEFDLGVNGGHFTVQ